jgi:hypothetical protein
MRLGGMLRWAIEHVGLPAPIIRLDTLHRVFILTLTAWKSRLPNLDGSEIDPKAQCVVVRISGDGRFEAARGLRACEAMVVEDAGVTVMCADGGATRVPGETSGTQR